MGMFGHFGVKVRSQGEGHDTEGAELIDSGHYAHTSSWLCWAILLFVAWLCRECTKRRIRCVFKGVISKTKSQSIDREHFE